MDSLSFAFCCLTFNAPSKDHLTLENRGGKYRIQDWAKDLDAALKTIPSVYDVTIDPPRGTTGRMDDGLLGVWGLTTADFGSKDEQYGKFTPHPNSGRVQFQLRIPKAIRERLTFGPTAHSEHFDVWTEYSGGIPATVVVGDDPRDGSGVTVPLVREFLLEEFRSRRDQLNGFEFVFLPPAPMHLQGLIRHGEAGQTSPSLRVEATKGYDLLELTVPPEDDLQPHLEDLFRGLVDELALFYSAVSMNNYHNDAGRFLNVVAESIVDSYRERGPKAYMKRLGSGYRHATNLQIMAVEADLARDKDAQSLLDAKNSRKRIVGDLVLADWIEREVADLEASSSPELGRIATLVSVGLSHSIQSAAVVISAVLGGAFGAGLTALLT